MLDLRKNRRIDETFYQRVAASSIGSSCVESGVITAAPLSITDYDMATGYRHCEWRKADFALSDMKFDMFESFGIPLQSIAPASAYPPLHLDAIVSTVSCSAERFSGIEAITGPISLEATESVITLAGIAKGPNLARSRKCHPRYDRYSFVVRLPGLRYMNHTTGRRRTVSNLSRSRPLAEI